ncbi:MAG: hypothetical protein KGQ46_09205 [Hyphomicrobiales bacterium]|nr:hypothetical protein [Hyphomicrobiales bacterium]MDE2115613.1 hypothetical protein [Hyphomicrobiales bacterium]
MTLSYWLLALVTVERIGELFLAKSNTQRLLAEGAFEAAPEHYKFIVLMHALWLAGLWFFAREIQPFWTVIFLLLQVLRFWVLATLGRRWTTKIIILPNAPLVRRGPYRWLSHPNYLVVIGEIAILPLCVGLPAYALVFSVVNAVMLTIRIRAENEALAGLRNGRHA